MKSIGLMLYIEMMILQSTMTRVAIKRAVVDSIGNDWSFVEQVSMWLLYLWSCKTCQISHV